MEMSSLRGDRKRYYTPWDPLQLSEEIDGGHRAYKNGVSFYPYRTFRKKVFFSPLVHKSAAYFFESEDNLVDLLNNFVTKVRKDLLGTLTFEAYSFSGKYEEIYQSLDDSFFYFRYHPFENSFKEFCLELSKHRDKIRVKSRESGFVEAPNKKLQFIMVEISEKERSQLREDVELQKVFLSLLQESFNERIFVVLLSDIVFPLPVNVVHLFDNSFFLGEKNMQYCRKLYYPDWVETQYSFQQVFVGLAYQRGNTKIVPLHYVKFTPNEYYNNKKLDRMDEERIYREFLESLEDSD